MASELLRLATSRQPRDPHQAAQITIQRGVTEEVTPMLCIIVGTQYVELTPEEADDVMATIADFMRTV